MISLWKYLDQKIGVDDLSLLVVISLFITSFLPLWISIIFIDIKSIICNSDNLYTESISIIAIVLANMLAGVVLNRWIRKETVTSDEMMVAHAYENKTVSAEYLLAYILPLFAFDFTQWDSVILFMIFFVTLGYICVKHHNFNINILLELMKYNVYDCKLKTEENDKVEIERKIISKIDLTRYKGRIIRIENLNNEYSLVRTESFVETE